MLKEIKKIKVFIIGILMLVLWGASGVSYADWSLGVGVDVGPRYHHRDRYYWEHHYYGWRDHPRCGWRAPYLPVRYETVWVRGSPYYYYDGLYYSSVGNEYALVQPPEGAYVTQIPADFQPVIIHGQTYYTNHDVYYVLTRPHQYKVVSNPVVVIQPAPVIQGVVIRGRYPVNIPNSHGGYTKVVIRRVANGYLGPQGEYYPRFPSVDQLRAMYGEH